MAQNNQLAYLASIYGTDKGPYEHNYTEMYDTMLKTISVTGLLEVGLGNGASMKMWRAYYPNARLYCIELFGDENKEKWQNSNGSNVRDLTMFSGNSTLEETWKPIPFNLDVIIDDGSHHPTHQIQTFEQGFNHLRPGGLYFIEDVHCNFEKRFTGGKDIIFQWLFARILEQQNSGPNFGGSFYKAQPYMPIIAQKIKSYHVFKSVIVLEKAGVPSL